MILSDLCNATNKNVGQNFVDIGTASINPFSNVVLISQIAHVPSQTRNSSWIIARGTLGKQNVKTKLTCSVF